MEKVSITGITKQDCSYPAEFLLSGRHEVHGIIRRASTFNHRGVILVLNVVYFFLLYT